MNKGIFIALGVAILAGFFIWKRNRTEHRIFMIDWLNVNKGNAGGLWTKLTYEELKTVFKVARLQSAGAVSQIQPVELAEMEEILKRYAEPSEIKIGDAISKGG